MAGLTRGDPMVRPVSLDTAYLVKGFLPRGARAGILDQDSTPSPKHPCHPTSSKLRTRSQSLGGVPVP